MDRPSIAHTRAVLVLLNVDFLLVIAVLLEIKVAAQELDKIVGTHVEFAVAHHDVRQWCAALALEAVHISRHAPQLFLVVQAKETCRPRRSFA